MKKLITLFTFLALYGCSADDNDGVPPATQTGTEMLACLIDGESFAIKGLAHIQCSYIYNNGGYYFIIGADNRDQNNILRGVFLRTNQLAIEEGGIYDLAEMSAGGASGQYFYNSAPYTSHVGKLTITKFDEENHIVSGTFWFDISYNNTVMEFRNGRFDATYTN